MFWAKLFFNVGEEILGGLFFILPLEGNNFAAKNKHILYTYHEWREGQHGVYYLVYHDQIFSPPTFHEPKVQEDFQELPCWRVTHFVWMIDWGMGDSYGDGSSQLI